MFNSLMFNIFQHDDEHKTIEIIEAYLKAGGDVDAIIKSASPCWCGYTALHFAVAFRRRRVVQYLLERNAAVEARNAKGLTVLDLALSPGNLAYGDLYIYDDDDDDDPDDEYKDDEADADVDDAIESDERSRARWAIARIVEDRCLAARFYRHIDRMHLGCAKGRRDLVEPGRINEPVDPSSPIWAGWTPLHVAANFERGRLIAWLLDNGAKPWLCDARNNTPLHLLSISRRRTYEPRLFVLEAEPTTQGFNGLTHFHIACLYSPRSLHLVRDYLRLGHSPDLPAGGTYSMEYTGLHYAVLRNCPELARLLLDHGAEVDARDAYGRTALYLLLQCCGGETSNLQGNALLEVCDALLEAGADARSSIAYVKPGTALARSFLGHAQRRGALRQEIDDGQYERLQGADQQCQFDEASFRRACEDELERMDARGGLGRLARELGANKLARYSLDSRLRFVIEDGFVEKFPIYGYVARYKLARGKRRRPLLDAAKATLQRLYRCAVSSGATKDLPDVCAEEILEHFKDRELSVLARMTTTAQVRPSANSSDEGDDDLSQ